MYSIVIPLYNKEFSIKETIQSIISQSYADYEIIVVDDGSTDRSTDIIKEFSDHRIRIISRENGGVSAARNTGIKTARYDYIAFIDADDVWLPRYLTEMDKLIDENPDCIVFSSEYYLEKNNKLELSHGRSLPISTGQVQDFFAIQKRYFKPIIWTSATIVKKEALLSVGMFDEKLWLGEDLDLWYRLTLYGNLAFLNHPLSIYKDFRKQSSLTNFKLTVENNILFNLDKYIEIEKANINLKRYLDKYRLKGLKQFYVSKEIETHKIQKVLGEVAPHSFTLKYKMLYLALPRKYITKMFSTYLYIKNIIK
jgi:glycosyltransferase involved in cell wall biosynthesis